jgi:NAD-dependent SIR2 family protein deacetylase
MRLSESKILSLYQQTPSEHMTYDFYRCHKCNWLFTLRYEKRATVMMNEGKQQGICKHCGSTRYSPSWPRFLGWLRPDVVAFVGRLILARGVAPFAEKKAQWALPYIERLVG